MKWKTKWMLPLVAGMMMLTPMNSAWASVDQKNLDTLTQVYKLLVDDHFTHPDQERLLQAAIQGMLDQLNDPFSNYFTPDEYQKFVSAIQQAYAGVGLLLQHSEDGQALVVQEVYPGTPAEKAGLQAGDRIVQVKDTPASSSNLDSLADLLRGQPGSSVTLQFVRGTAAPQSLTLIRQAIQLPMVTEKDLGDGVGYIRIYSFGDRTTLEFNKALHDLQSKGMKKLVLDLRGNGGGMVKSALEIADQFLTQGVILQMHHDGKIVKFEADSAGDDQLPVDVLIDRHSASASEILAGALQKNGRAKLIGETSYGKGTMQEPVELPNGGYLKVSIDQWLLADGKTPDHVGLTPDVRMTRPESFMNAALADLQPNRPQSVVLDLTGKRLLSPIEVGGHLLVPLRYTVEMLGAPVTWLSDQNEVHFTLHDKPVTVRLTDGVVTVDGKQLHGELVRTLDGTTFLSLEVLQALQVHVEETNSTLDLRLN